MLLLALALAQLPVAASIEFIVQTKYWDSGCATVRKKSQSWLFLAQEGRCFKRFPGDGRETPCNLHTPRCTTYAKYTCGSSEMHFTEYSDSACTEQVGKKTSYAKACNADRMGFECGVEVENFATREFHGSVGCDSLESDEILPLDTPSGEFPCSMWRCTGGVLRKEYYSGAEDAEDCSGERSSCIIENTPVATTGCYKKPSQLRSECMEEATVEGCGHEIVRCNVNSTSLDAAVNNCTNRYTTDFFSAPTPAPTDVNVDANNEVAPTPAPSDVNVNMARHAMAGPWCLPVTFLGLLLVWT